MTTRPFGELQMAALHDQIQKLMAELEHYSPTTGLAPIRWAKRSFNRPFPLAELGEGMNQALRRI
jgi:hypothetical protein